jgi:LDH2 family malate/lactate/ureidoglycolate dehydrogenase
MAAFVKSSLPAAGYTEVLTPGESEHRQRRQREDQGIELPDAVAQKLRELADKLGLPANEVPFT